MKGQVEKRSQVEESILRERELANTRMNVIAHVHLACIDFR